MTGYHKIQTVYKRNPETKFKTLLVGIYALPEFEYLAGNTWVFTEKVDGTNIRVIFDGRCPAFAGKTDNAQIPAFLLESLGQLFKTIEAQQRLSDVFPDSPACLYGEGYGAKIQKGGGKYRPDPGFVLFDVRVGDWWLQRADVEDVAKRLGIDVVPIVGTGNLHQMVGLAADGFKSAWGDFPAEGIVARPEVELQTRRGERIITKIKHRDFQGAR